VRGTVSYGELDGLANRIANGLLEAGIRPGNRVALFLPKSADAIAATQAVLRAGAAYVPIDPTSPAARAATIAKDCQVAAVIGAPAQLSALADKMDLPACLALESDELRAELSAFPTSLHAVTPRAPGDLAYILYTSGSTGTPKGVCISHHNALAFIDWARATLGPTPADVLSNHAPLHFDLSVLDLYVAFASGASVAIVPEAAAFVPRRLVELIERHRITIWYSVPSALILMMQSGGLLEGAAPSLKQILFAGEPFPPAQLARLRDHFRAARLLNLYGPTETNVCTYYEVPAIREDDTIPLPIGVACCGDEAWAETSPGSVAEAGEEGELFVRGPTVMLGYWGHPPHAKGTPYRTGDLVRVRADGGFDYLGRRDHMVKLRGHRVELGEVEAALSAHPAVAQVAATVTGSGMNAKLVAVAVAAGAERPGLLALKAFCAERLPRYMIIDRVTWLDALPRTDNGKLDRRALGLHLNSLGRQDHDPEVRPHSTRSSGEASAPRL
jgi:amino acid adenylation domain-containing protein